MTSLPSSRALGALLAAWLLCCCGVAEAVFSTPFILARNPIAGTPQMRREIKDFMADRYRATIFIRTLLSLQARPVTRLDSYSRLAGIHGSRTYFDGVRSGTDGVSGYCVHGNSFFGPWHRPFLSILEQAFYERANELAALYTTRDAASYVTAASTFRLPYWDWAAAGGSVPAIFLQTQVTVTLANGTASTVNNPLFRSTLLSDAMSTFQIPSRRNPTSRASGWTTTYQGRLSTLRANAFSMFKAQNYSCFVNNNNYAPSTAVPPCDNTANLEDLHNLVHGTIGGNMNYLAYASFDPIFFLHHCNVDRQMAIWEGIKPAERMDSIVNRVAYPFRKDSTSYWTTRDIMNVYDTTGLGTRRFGYFYPEFSTTVTSSQLLAKVAALYDDAAGQTRVLATFSDTSSAQIDGTSSIAVASGGTTTTADRAGARRDSTRRTRRTVVVAGRVPLVKRSSRLGRFSVRNVNVDITDAVAKLKATNPDLTSIDIIATVTPDSGSATASNQATQVVSMGTPRIATVVDGKIVAFTAAPGQLYTAPGKNNADEAKDVKLFERVGEVKAVVTP